MRTVQFQVLPTDRFPLPRLATWVFVLLVTVAFPPYFRVVELYHHHSISMVVFSASVPVALQYKVELMFGVLGDITGVVMSGIVFCIVTAAEDAAEYVVPSYARTVQFQLSPLERFPLPKVLISEFTSFVTVALPPLFSVVLLYHQYSAISVVFSVSVSVALHVSGVVLFGDVGAIDTELMVGAVFESVTAADLVIE